MEHVHGHVQLVHVHLQVTNRVTTECIYVFKRVSDVLFQHALRREILRRESFRSKLMGGNLFQRPSMVFKTLVHDANVITCTGTNTRQRPSST